MLSSRCARTARGALLCVLIMLSGAAAVVLVCDAGGVDYMTSARSVWHGFLLLLGEGWVVTEFVPRYQSAWICVTHTGLKPSASKSGLKISASDLYTSEVLRMN